MFSEYQSKICPYGYRKGEDGRLAPDPETSEVVQKIFGYAVNLSLIHIWILSAANDPQDRPVEDEKVYLLRLLHQ